MPRSGGGLPDGLRADPGQPAPHHQADRPNRHASQPAAAPAPLQAGSAFADNQAALRAQGLLFLLGGGIFLWFLGSLRGFLARAEGGTGRLATVALAAGVASTMVTVVALTFQIGLAAASGGSVQPALVAVMDALFTAANVPLAVMLVAVALVSLRTKAFPAWLGWLSAAVPSTPEELIERVRQHQG